MPSIKDILDALNKMANLQLNVAIFITCMTLIYLSTPEKFILEPFPKVIIQSLILITSTRIVFAVIGALHESIKNKVDTSRKEKKEIALKGTQQLEYNQRKKELLQNLNKLDIFQLKIVGDLLITNNLLVSKGAVLFSLKNMNIIYSVSIGEKYEGVSLTPLAADVIDKELVGNMNAIEINAITAFFKKLPNHEKEMFDDFLSTDCINTHYDRFGSYKISKHSATFGHYQDTILFQHPIRNYEFRIGICTKQVLNNLKESESIIPE